MYDGMGYENSPGSIVQIEKEREAGVPHDFDYFLRLYSMILVSRQNTFKRSYGKEEIKELFHQDFRMDETTAPVFTIGLASICVSLKSSRQRSSTRTHVTWSFMGMIQVSSSVHKLNGSRAHSVAHMYIQNRKCHVHNPMAMIHESEWH